MFCRGLRLVSIYAAGRDTTGRLKKPRPHKKEKRNKRQVATCVRSFELESSSGGPTATISSISLLCAFVVSRRHEKVPPRGRRRSQSKQSRVACSLLGQKTEIVSPQLHGRPFSAFSLRPLLLHGAKRNLRAKCCDHRKINPSAEQMEADSSPKKDESLIKRMKKAINIHDAIETRPSLEVPSRASGKPGGSLVHSEMTVDSFFTGAHRQWMLAT